MSVDLIILADILTALGAISILLMVMLLARRLIGHRKQVADK